MGLVMLGSKSAQAIEDMVAYSQETQHEKILRGLAVGELTSDPQGVATGSIRGLVSRGGQSL